MSSVFLNKVSVWYVKCDPKAPSKKMNPDSPQWEVQIRTTDPAEKDRWEAMGLPVKFFIPPGKGPAEGYFRVNLNKRAFRKDGSPSQPVEVVTGNLQPLDPNTVGNDSTANLRLLPRDYKDKQGRDKQAWTLMGIQVTRLVPYEPGARSFESDEYTVDKPYNGGFPADGDDAYAAEDAAAEGKPVGFTPPVTERGSDDF